MNAFDEAITRAHVRAVTDTRRAWRFTGIVLAGVAVGMALAVVVLVMGGRG